MQLLVIRMSFLKERPMVVDSSEARGLLAGGCREREVESGQHDEPSAEGGAGRR